MFDVDREFGEIVDLWKIDDRFVIIVLFFAAFVCIGEVHFVSCCY